jgi:Protein of unknown function (DUF2721)
MDPTSISEGIQLALAPVFLLTAVANLVSALTHRLARVVDRSRFLQNELADEPGLSDARKKSYQNELEDLTRRGWLINISMAFVVICGLMIGLTVLELFFSEAVGGKVQFSKLVLSTFVSGIGSFVFSLLLLLAEVLVASYSIRWKHPG